MVMARRKRDPILSRLFDGRRFLRTVRRAWIDRRGKPKRKYLLSCGHVCQSSTPKDVAAENEKRKNCPICHHNGLMSWMNEKRRADGLPPFTEASHPRQQ